MPEPFHLNGDGQGADIPESVEELQGAVLRLKDLKAKDGILTTMTRQELSLLKGLDVAPNETKDRFTEALRHANFISDEEMAIHINAYNEAVYLGMDTEFNVQYVEGLKGTNRKGGFRNNLIGSFLDGLSHQKYTANTPREKGGGSTNPRSPLS